MITAKPVKMKTPKSPNGKSAVIIQKADELIEGWWNGRADELTDGWSGRWVDEEMDGLSIG